MVQAKKRPSLTVFAMIAATLLSKLLGMARGMIMAWTLADSLSAVAFTAAYRIPGAIFDFALSAAILGCFIPAYGKAKTESEKRARIFSASFLCAVTAISVLLYIAFCLSKPFADFFNIYVSSIFRFLHPMKKRFGNLLRVFGNLTFFKLNYFFISL